MNGQSLLAFCEASRLTTWSSVRLLLPLDCWPITIWRTENFMRPDHEHDKSTSQHNKPSADVINVLYTHKYWIKQPVFRGLSGVCRWCPAVYAKQITRLENWAVRMFNDRIKPCLMLNKLMNSFIGLWVSDGCFKACVSDHAGRRSFTRCVSAARGMLGNERILRVSLVKCWSCRTGWSWTAETGIWTVPGDAVRNTWETPPDQHTQH